MAKEKKRLFRIKQMLSNCQFYLSPFFTLLPTMFVLLLSFINSFLLTLFSLVIELGGKCAKVLYFRSSSDPMISSPKRAHCAKRQTICLDCCQLRIAAARVVSALL